MSKIFPEELKSRFIQVLTSDFEVKSMHENPFILKYKKKEYWIFLKNLTSAAYKNLPDVARAQMAYKESFNKIAKSPLPFILLGYDSNNDTFNCWDGALVKQRLNSKDNISLYSRWSLQENIKKGEIREGFLKNGDKVVIFKRASLPLFFEELNTLFSHGATEEKELISGKPADSASPILVKIEDTELIKQITPLLKGNRVLEAVQACSKFYGNKYGKMTFKQWFSVVNNLYKEVAGSN